MPMMPPAKAARLWLLAAHEAVRGRHASHEMARLSVPVNDRELLHVFGADVLDDRQFANGLHVGRRDAYALAGALAAGLQARLTRPRHDRPFRERAAEAGIQRPAE